jgi:hypothetical protein
MRELKFRAFQKKQPHQKVALGYVYSKDYDSLEAFFHDNEGEDIDQFIGLYDFHGQGAYFGDLVKTKIGQFEYIRPIYALENGCPVIDLPTIDSNMDKPMFLFTLNCHDIVGNIRENLDLLV